MSEERKVGHKALRAKNGKLEIFDPHPFSDQEEKWKEEASQSWDHKFPDLIKTANNKMDRNYFIVGYLLACRVRSKERQEEIEKLEKIASLYESFFLNEEAK